MLMNIPGYARLICSIQHTTLGWSPWWDYCRWGDEHPWWTI